MPFPHALLRAGYPYLRVLGMRRVTTFPVGVAVGDDRIYVIGRSELGVGGNIRMVSLDDEDLGTMADTGLVWPAALLRDHDNGDLYVLDEATHKLTVYSAEGEQLKQWGEHGSEPGQLDRPAGMDFDAEGNLWIVDTLNNRLQRFSRDGEYLGGFGEAGAGPGQFDLPWGVALDAEGDLYVSDWRNDRLQKLSPSGEHLMTIDGARTIGVEFAHPTGIGVDEHGDIYVADRDRNRVLLFDKTGRYVQQFTGEATLSKMGRTYILANQKTLRLREMTSIDPVKRLRFPQGLRVEGDKLYICDFGSHRVQVFQKEAYPLNEDQIMPEPTAPTLMTT